MRNLSAVLLSLICLCGSVHAGSTASMAAPWVSDLGNGEYRNPILFADYSDPDVIAVGDDFYMTASSFHATPGLPILHSKDLVNWNLVNYALPILVPESNFNIPQHGNGVWAPSFRYHDGKYWIFYPDPDYGIYVITADDPRQEWTKPRLILAGKGLIDPTPLWDDDGQAYLLHGWAKSRAGINNLLTLHPMSEDGLRVEENSKVIIDANKIPGYRTLEGPKFYKHKGYYYVFAPAGGVPVGWQSVFRSKHIEGPYEYRTVMEQGETLTNGPHQGAWVRTTKGEDWFIHFQSHDAYGRIVHLQPMHWQDDWPVIGRDADGDGIGNPVRRHKKPTLKPSLINTIAIADSFSGDELGMQWQWNANSETSWYDLNSRKGYLRLKAHSLAPSVRENMWLNPAILLQKLPALEFMVQTTIEVPKGAGELEAGLIMYGEDYAWVGLKNIPGEGLTIGIARCEDARSGCEEHFKPFASTNKNRVTLRMTTIPGGVTAFSYKDDNDKFVSVGELFRARPGRWVGARMGVFCRQSEDQKTQANFVDIENFELVELQQ